MDRLPQHLEQIFLMVDRHAGANVLPRGLYPGSEARVPLSGAPFRGPMLVNLERRKYCECSEDPDSEKK